MKRREFLKSVGIALVSPLVVAKCVETPKETAVIKGTQKGREYMWQAYRCKQRARGKFRSCGDTVHIDLGFVPDGIIVFDLQE